MTKPSVRVGTPCSLDWNSFTPAEGGRFCGDCKKVVRDLSAMTEDEAKALLAEAKNTELCVRYVHDRDGAIRFAPEPRELVPATLLVRAKRTLTAALAAAVPMTLVACAPSSLADDSNTPWGNARHDDDEREVMGGMVWTPPETDVPGDADAAADGGARDSGPTVDASGDDAARDGGDAGPISHL